jgi:hypothetical protein
MDYNEFLGKFLNEHKDEFVKEMKPNLKTIDISEPDVKKQQEIELKDILYVLGFRKLNKLLFILSKLSK